MSQRIRLVLGRSPLVHWMKKVGEFFVQDLLRDWSGRKKYRFFIKAYISYIKTFIMKDTKITQKV